MYLVVLHLSILKDLSMHPSRLILCFLIATASLVCEVEAQSCYKKTDEFVLGNFFVKPMTDSTCFGQGYDELRYFNFKTGVTRFSFLTEQYYPHPHIGIASITDVLMFDSILVVCWEQGDVHRILKVDHQGIVSEIPTALDSIPLLKFGVVGTPYSRRLNTVNDSIFMMSNNTSIYTFHLSVDTITCIDSMSIPTVWPEASAFMDMYGDSIVLISGPNDEARFYHVDAVGKIAYSAATDIDKDVDFVEDFYFRYGHLYALENGYWRALLRTAEGFKLAPGKGEGDIIAMIRPLFGNENVMIVGFYDEIRVYDQEFNLLCHKAPLISLTVMSSGIYGDKIFLATSDGITTWLPDTSTTSITSPPIAYRPSAIEVWPNPSASGTIAVRSEEPAAAIELMDASGRIIYRASQPGVGATIIPTALLPVGVYFVNAHTAQGILKERVVILRGAE